MSLDEAVKTLRASKVVQIHVEGAEGDVMTAHRGTHNLRNATLIVEAHSKRVEMEYLPSVMKFGHVVERLGSQLSA
jgi:hypothetical protein